jgi:nucleoside-diphosphate-sugar epimerase
LHACNTPLQRRLFREPRVGRIVRRMSELHLVLGAGQVGAKVVDLLLARGERVRVVRRGPAGPARPGLEQRSGDLTNLDFAREVGRGVDVVYQCINPAYDAWPRELPRQTAGVIAAASVQSSRLVVLDNLYMYDPARGAMREDSPNAPRSKKGALRVVAADAYFEAHRRGDLQVAMARAADFFGPDSPNASVFGFRFFDAVASGSAVDLLGDPSQPHSYNFTRDVAEGLVALGARRDVFGEIWHLPAAPAESTAAWVARFGAALGTSIRTRVIPDWVLRAMGVFQPVLREVAEMTYQWKTPFVLDDTKARTSLGLGHTPPEQAVEATLRWLRDVRGSKSAAA